MKLILTVYVELVSYLIYARYACHSIGLFTEYHNATRYRMIELSVIRDLVAIFAGIVGLSYYIMTVRHQNSSRKAQLFIEMYQDFKRPDVQKAFNDIVNVWQLDSPKSVLHMKHS